MQYRFILFFLLTAILPFFSYSETIELKSGRVISGKILEQSNEYIRVDVEGVPITYYFEQIKSIDGRPLYIPQNYSPQSTQEKSPQKIFQTSSPAVVSITTYSDGVEQSLGTGFVVKPDGVIVTNYHVIQSGGTINVSFKDGKIYPVTGIIYYDLDRDICLLKIDAFGLITVPLGDSDAVPIGTKLYCIGNPLGFEYTISDGLLSARRNLQELNWLQFSAPISPGNSGGPLMDSQGKVVGVVTFYVRGGQNLNFALAINEVKPFINSHTKFSVSDFLTASQSQDALTGSYSISRGQNPDRTTYTGTVDITKRKDVYRLIWKFPSSYNRVVYEGVGINVDNILCVGWDVVAKPHGVVVYKVDGGKLKGKWAVQGSGAIGTEDLEGPSSLSGIYKIASSSSSVHEKGYTGTVTIEKRENMYFLTWAIENEKHFGVGILQDDLLIAGWGKELTTGLVFYRIKGQELTGKWAIPGSTDIGFEDLSKISQSYPSTSSGYLEVY